MNKRKLETCFSPALFEAELHKDSIVVILDILRASSAICTAFANGARSILPVSEISEAREYKSKGYLVAAERDGFVLDFADFGNSPFNFTREKVEGKTLVYSTTNGTGLIKLASSSYLIVIGSFLNLSALCSWLIKQDRNVLLLCAGWKNRFNIEDSICAGAIGSKLMQSDHFTTSCDSTYAAIDLWTLAAPDLNAYIEKAAQRTRLRDKNLDDCISFCLTPDYTSYIPVMKDGVLVGSIHEIS
jgi:2-phosphosulfolactate phosphatase